MQSAFGCAYLWKTRLTCFFVFNLSGTRIPSGEALAILEGEFGGVRCVHSAGQASPPSRFRTSSSARRKRRTRHRVSVAPVTAGLVGTWGAGTVGSRIQLHWVAVLSAFSSPGAAFVPELASLGFAGRLLPRVTNVPFAARKGERPASRDAVCASRGAWSAPPWSR